MRAQTNEPCEHEHSEGRRERELSIAAILSLNLGIKSGSYFWETKKTLTIKWRFCSCQALSLLDAVTSLFEKAKNACANKRPW